jgi:signal peptidase I
LPEKNKNEKNPATEKNGAAAPPAKPKETLPESIASIASVLVSGLFIITFVFQAFEIPSGSMENTLLVGDHLFVDRLGPTAKASYMGPLIPYRDIKRGDIVVFLTPNPSEAGLFLVKRIMGVPGDHLHLDHGVLYVNGVRQNEPYLNPDKGYYPYIDDFPSVPPTYYTGLTPEWLMDMPSHLQNGELVIPRDHYFGMGDNRSNSRDSRFWGLIPRENIIGRPLFVYWSFKTPADQSAKTTFAERAAFLFHIVVHFFDETRWSRMFHRVH